MRLGDGEFVARRDARGVQDGHDNVVSVAVTLEFTVEKLVDMSVGDPAFRRRKAEQLPVSPGPEAVYELSPTHSRDRFGQVVRTVMESGVDRFGCVLGDVPSDTAAIFHLVNTNLETTAS